MRPTAAAFAVAFLLPFVALAEQARDTATTTSAVLVTTAGKLTEHDRALAGGAAEARVRGAGWSLTTKPFAAKEIDAVAACLRDIVAWPCVAKVVGGRGIRRVAVVALNRNEAPDGAPQVVIVERLVLAEAELVVLGQRFCERCTDDTLAALTAELTTELLQRAQLDSGRTVLAVRSTPQGALYSVDGTLSGATDATIDIVPGRHLVTIEKEGFESATRSVDAVEGKTANVSVTLQRLEPATPLHVAGSGKSAGAAHHSRALPITMVAAGSATIVGGVIALALNQHAVTKPADQDQPRGYYNTIPVGVALVVGGALVGGAGGYLWWKYVHDDKHPSPAVTPTAGGAVVGVQGAF
jgi:PEGA domain